MRYDAEIGNPSGVSVPRDCTLSARAWNDWRRAIRIRGRVAFDGLVAAAADQRIQDGSTAQ